MNNHLYKLVPINNSDENYNQCMLMRPNEVAQLLGVSKKHLSNLSKTKNFPKRVRIGTRAIGWRRGDLEQWVSEGGKCDE